MKQLLNTELIILDNFLLHTITEEKGIGRKAWKQAGRKRKEAPEEPPSGENGKKGKERAEG